MRTTDPWAAYWHADHPGSCISLASAADEAELSAFWAGFAASLAPGTRVLDLATGNGVVPGYLLQGNPDLDVTGMDRAAIDPHRYLADSRHLERVRFIGGLDLAEASGRLGTFAALTSQFGLEYAPLTLAAEALAGLLAREGRFQLLLHHADSDVVVPRRRDLAELRALLEEEAPGSALARFGRGELAGRELEAITREYLGRTALKTRRITGALVSAIDRLLTGQEQGTCDGSTDALDLHQRLCAEHTRLQEMLSAALDADALDEFVRLLQSTGLTVETCATLTLGRQRGSPTVVGWQLAGGR